MLSGVASDQHTGTLTLRVNPFSLTQVLDRPVTGRVFFEEVIRENLDFRTRVITDGVGPSLHVDYENTRIKQYHKEGRALRTETTFNNTRDFGIGKLLKNLPAPGRSAFRPTGGSSTSSEFRMTNAYRRSLPCWLYSASRCEGSTTAKCVCLWHNCRPRSGQLSHRKDDLRPAPSSPSRNRRTHPAQPPLSTHCGSTTHCAVLFQNLRAAATPHSTASTP